jgi:hypothetical protein
VDAKCAIPRPSDASLTLPVPPLVQPAERASAAPLSPRQALVEALTLAISTAHAAGDLAAAQIAARTLGELLGAPMASQQGAPVVNIASARRSRS